MEKETKTPAGEEYVKAAKKKYRNALGITPELTEAIKNGSNEAFSKLYLHFNEPLLDFVKALIPTIEDAEEIVQDTFTYIWTNRETLSLERNIKGLMYTCAKNDCLDYFRRRKVSGVYCDLSQASEGEELSHDQVVIARETALIIEMTVSNMPNQRRRVFELSRNDGKSIMEIANTLKISQSAVKQHLAAARKDIKTIIMCVVFFLLIN